MFRDPTSIHIQKWSRALRSRGIEVVTIAVDQGRSELLRREQQIVITEVFSSNILTRAVRFVLRRAGFSGWIHKQLAKQLDEELVRWNVEILHVHGIQFYGEVASYLEFRPYLVSIYGSDIFQAKTDRTTFDHYVKCFEGSCFVESSSSYAARFARDNYGFDESKIKVFPWGVDLESFRYRPELTPELREKYGIRVEDTVIYSHRSLNPVYNYRVLLEAVQLVSKEYPHLKFILIKGNGKPENVEFTRKFLEENDLVGSVLFFDQYLPDEQIVEFYQLSDAFISIPETDNIADSLMEGMAMQCFPILGDVPTYRDIFSEENAVIIPDHDNPENVAEGLRRFIQRQDKKDVVERNYKFARNQTWHNVAERQITLYHECANITPFSWDEKSQG